MFWVKGFRGANFSSANRIVWLTRMLPRILLCIRVHVRERIYVRHGIVYYNTYETQTLNDNIDSNTQFVKPFPPQSHILNIKSCSFQCKSICLNWIIVVTELKNPFSALKLVSTTVVQYSCVCVNIHRYHMVTWDQIILSILTFHNRMQTSQAWKGPASMHCAWTSWSRSHSTRQFHLAHDRSHLWA